VRLLFGVGVVGTLAEFAGAWGCWVMRAPAAAGYVAALGLLCAVALAYVALSRP
jgi:NADPH:quinone reductase-like Zn-dependent oxidoreductase